MNIEYNSTYYYSSTTTVLYEAPSTELLPAVADAGAGGLGDLAELPLHLRPRTAEKAKPKKQKQTIEE